MFRLFSSSPRVRFSASWLPAFLVLVGFALAGRTAVAQTAVHGGVHVTADQAWPALNDRNYTYLRTQLENLTGEPRTVRIEVRLWGYGSISSEPQQAVLELSARETRELEWVLPQWVNRDSGSLSYTVDGARDRARFNFQPNLQPRGSDWIDRSLVVVTGQTLNPGWELDQAMSLSTQTLPDQAPFREPAPLSMATEYEWSILKHDFAEAGIDESVPNLKGRPLSSTGLYEVTRMSASSLPECVEPYTGISALLLDTDSLPLPGSRMRRVRFVLTAVSSMKTSLCGSARMRG